MGKYQVLEDVTYVQGGKAILHRRAATDVKIDDAVASKLGDRVRAVGGEDKEPAKAAESQGKPGGK